MENMNLVPSNAKTTITQDGDHNIAIAHVENVNLTVTAPPAKEGNLVQRAFWGDVEISPTEAKLLDEFFNDYDNVIIECIKTDFSCPGIDLYLADKITIPYQEKWDFKSLKFRQPELRKTVLDTLSILIELTGYLSPEHMRMIPDYPSDNCLIPINNSYEAGCWVREVLRPETEKLRYKLRDLYRILHPEDYVGIPEFSDHYEDDSF